MRFVEPTAENLSSWNDWLAERPAHVRAVAERFDPWSLFLMMPTKERVTVVGFSEQADRGVTLRIAVTGEFNLVDFDKQVFGVSPNDLEPCDLPAPGEVLGVLMVEDDDKAAYIDMMRLKVRPDLWERGADGVVRRKP